MAVYRNATEREIVAAVHGYCSDLQCDHADAAWLLAYCMAKFRMRPDPALQGLLRSSDPTVASERAIYEETVRTLYRGQIPAPRKGCSSPTSFHKKLGVCGITAAHLKLNNSRDAGAWAQLGADLFYGGHVGLATAALTHTLQLRSMNRTVELEAIACYLHEG